MSEKGAVLVTGAGRRLGAAIARRMAADGWRVVLHANTSTAEADKIAEELRQAGKRADVVQGDLSDETQVATMTAALARAGDWVGVINSAATFVRDDIDTLRYEAAIEQLRINLIAPVALARALKLQIGDRQGFVTNIADQKVLNPNPDFISYTLSKLAIASATDTLAMALAPRVRVNCIAPGLMLPSGDQSEEQFRRVHPLTALKRGTRLEDVADACAYLAGAENVTGAMISVDAGQHLIGSVRDVMFT